MSVEENKENIRRHVEVFNTGDLSIVDELIAPNYIAQSPAGEAKGPDGFRQVVVTMRSTFPDLHYTIDDMVAEGDWVAVRYTLTGTFTGELGGIAPTGKKLTRTEAIFHRFEGGKQIEMFGYLDRLTAYQQLGIPIPTE